MNPGDIVADRFLIEGRAGSGGMGTVYRARDQRSDAPVALKVLDDQGGANGVRFAQEAAFLADLEHPAVVRYVAHGDAQGAPFLAMEWLEGEDLAAHLARGPISIGGTLALGKRVAGALAAAHARGIIHRDVKPTNLFLERSEPQAVKVLDFGIARLMPSGDAATARPLTRTGMVIGTIGYMSPEQARGERDLDARADVFALGCVLFECLTGRPAFVGDHLVAVLAKILLDEAPRVSTLRNDVPPALDDLLARMLAKDIWSRPENGAEVERALASIPADPISRETARPIGEAALADREQRLVTIVLARVLDVAVARTLAEPFGGEIFVLAEGTLVVSFRAVRGATDQVARAAACALELAKSSVVAVATGRLETTGERFVGPIVDRVADLLGNASPGVVTVDAISAGLLEGRFDVRGAGDRFTLHGTTRERLAPRTLLGRVTPCVGREKELALLEATFRESIEEPIARAILVTGPAGSGKTRLAHELVARLELGESTVLLARGDPVGAGSAMTLMRQLVRAAARIDEATDRRVALDAHLAEIVSEGAREMLAELAGVPPEAPGPQLRAARNDASIMAGALRRALAEWIDALVRRGPVLLVLEDIHWGDAASVAQLTEALRTHSDRPLMALALARPEVHELFPRLWSAADVQEIRLTGLTKSACERLIRAAMPEASREAIAQLAARADGNAFYLEELVRHAVERADEALPETVLALVQARIAGLEPDARRFLRVASIFGESFAAAGVSALTQGMTVVPSLRALVEREVLVASPRDAEFSFRHSLLREAAYAMLTDEDRAAGHRLAAEWLEESGAKGNALVIAEHFERAGEIERALVHLADAAYASVSLGQMSGGAALAQRGLERGASGEVRGRLLLAEALAMGAAGELVRGAALSREARLLLPQGGSEWFVAVSTMLATAVRLNDFSDVPSVIAEVLAIEGNIRPSSASGLAIHMLVDILDSVDQCDLAEQLLVRAESLLAEPDVDPIFNVALLLERASFLFRRDADIGRLVKIVERVEALLAPIPDSAMTPWVHYIRGVIDFELGVLDRGDRALAQAILLFESSGARMWAGWARLHLGWSKVCTGHHDEAIAIAESLFDSPDARHARVLAAAAHHEAGRLAEAEQLVTRVVDGLEHELLPPWLINFMHIMHARIAHSRGRPNVLDLVPRPRAPSAWSIANRTIYDELSIVVAHEAGDRDRLSALVLAARARLDRHSQSLADPMLRATFEKQHWNARLLESFALAHEG